jgi:hypothetical protein
MIVGIAISTSRYAHRAIHDRAHPAGQPRALTRHEDVGSVECRAGARFALELRQRLSTFSINSRNSAIVALRFAGSRVLETAAGERRLGLVLVLSTSSCRRVVPDISAPNISHQAHEDSLGRI